MALPAASFELVLRYMCCMCVIPSSNRIPFAYEDIVKRSMLTDPTVYHRVLCTLCSHLELDIIPPIAVVAENYGFQRFVERTKQLVADYKVVHD